MTPYMNTVSRIIDSKTKRPHFATDFISYVSSKCLFLEIENFVR